MKKQNILIIGIKSFLRLLAAHCIIPALRNYLYSLSGIKIGKKAYINMYVIFEDEYISNMITIGGRVAVAKNVSFIASSHPNNSKLAERGTIKLEKITIEDDVWIGTGVVILPGVKIGKCSIIGANAVVTKNVEPYSIITGIPGRKTGDVREKFKINE